MIVRRFHPVGPHSVRFLQEAFDLGSRQIHRIKHILIFVKTEHIADRDIPFIYFCVKG